MILCVGLRVPICPPFAPIFDVDTWHLLIRSLASTFPGVEGGLGAGVDMPSASVDIPSVSVEMPPASGAVDLPSGSAEMPSAGGEISGDLPSVDAKLTGPDVDVKGDDSSLVAGLAAGVTAAVGAAAAGLGLSGKADKPDVEVRVFFVLSLCSGEGVW